MESSESPKDYFFHFFLFALPIVAAAFLGYIQIVYLPLFDDVTFSPLRKQESQLAAVLPSLPTTGSWAEFPNSKLRPAMSADPTPWHGNQKYIFDYSGGEFDAERNELIVWGGGHGDYSGNEVCIFPFSTGMWSCTPRSVAPYASSNPGPAETRDTLADGNPDARHTYSCLARVNLPGYDGFFCHGGSLWQGGYPVNGTWFFHRDTKTWEKLPPRPLWGESAYGATSLATFATFDPVSQRVLVLGRNRCMAFDLATKTWESKGSCNGGELEKSVALDPERRIMVVLGAGSLSPSNAVMVFDISKTPWTLIRTSLAGDQTPVKTRGTGLVFDPVGKRYIAHTGGQNLWVIDRDTWTVSVLSGSGANPGPMYPVGNMGRFRYVPSTNGLVVVNSIDSNVFYYQLGGTPQPPPPPLTPAPTDTAVPTVSLSSPLSGATVSGTVTVSANASDNVSILGVQFKLDGSNLGVEDTSSPYSVSWNTTSASNVSHTLAAVARDAAGNNTTASSITVTVNNIVTPTPISGPISTDTWIAIKSPTALTGPSYAATLYEKHLSLAYSPKTKRIYFHGGDTQKYAVGPNYVTYGGSSYYQGTHSFDLNLRLASPGQVNAGYATEYPFCSTGTDVQPKHPDYVGIQWVPWLDKLVIVPGLFYTSNTNCPGETSNYSGDPQYVWRKIMSFDVVTKKWAVLSANNGLINTDAPWQFYADPVTRQFVRVLNSGAPLEGQHYDPATDTWARYRTTGNSLICGQSHLAVLDRKMYCASRDNGLFGYYNIDAHTAVQVGSLPGDLWPSNRVPSDKGYIFAVPGARKIVYAERLAAGTAQYRIWAWSPEAPTWVRIDNTLPWRTLDGEVLPTGEMPQGSTGVVDTDTGILYLTGCYDCSTKYSWAIKLSSSNTPPPPVSDTTSPTVSITSPSSSASVSGTFTVSANASDNIGIVGVQFKLDGANLGTEDTSSPYSISWDTTLSSNASHTLTAIARDAAGNVRTAPTITVTVNNAPPPPATLTCSPLTQTIQTNLPASFSASGGTSSYSWAAPSGNPASGSGASFYTTYTTSGTRTVTLTSDTQTASCRVTVTPPLPSSDTQAPSIPLGLSGSVLSTSKISISWNTSIDNEGVIGYKISRNGSPFATSPIISYVDSNLSPSTSYTYTVSAYDLAGNTSGPSNSFTLTTLPLAEPLVILPPTPITPLASPTPVFQTPLYLSLRHPEVASLQRLLISKGLLLPGNDTGYFGPLTQEAVRKFQCEQGIVCSGRPEETGYGLVGTRTRERLNELSATNSSPQISSPLTESQRQALIQQLTEQIKQLQIQLLQLQLKLLQERLNGQL